MPYLHKPLNDFPHKLHLYVVIGNAVQILLNLLQVPSDQLFALHSLPFRHLSLVDMTYEEVCDLHVLLVRDFSLVVGGCS